jgi:hypothetical protein
MLIDLLMYRERTCIPKALYFVWIDNLDDLLEFLALKLEVCVKISSKSSIHGPGTTSMYMGPGRFSYPRTIPPRGRSIVNATEL